MRKILSIALALAGYGAGPAAASPQTVTFKPVAGKSCRETAVFINGEAYLLWVCR